VISIKKLMDRDKQDLFQASLESYRAVLNVIGESGVQACPPIGSTLRESLLNLQSSLGAEASADELEKSRRQAEAEITQWGSGAAGYFKARAAEVKELMLILAQAAELTGERDQRYMRQFHEFTGRLEAMADLHDLPMIRDSLVKSAMELKHCVEAMAEESQKSVARLRADMQTYQTRLDDAERLASLDPLTGLDNRRGVEMSIELRMAQKKPFSVLLLDLNGFKQTNDTYGHQAADELLKQFSSELKSGFRATDVVGRVGGDEFIVVLDAGLQEADGHIKRIARWVFGDYTVQTGNGSKKVPLTAAVGAAEWKAGDTLRSLMDRADAAMYRDKRKGG